MTNNAKPISIKLFHVRSVASRLHGHRDVWIDWFVTRRACPLFGQTGSLGVLYADAIKGYDPCNPSIGYVEDALEELFTEDEANAFVAWVKRHRHDQTATIRPAELPFAANSIGLGGVAFGSNGDPDCLEMWSAPDFDLPFKVCGHYDIRHCEPVTVTIEASCGKSFTVPLVSVDDHQLNILIARNSDDPEIDADLIAAMRAEQKRRAPRRMSHERERSVT